MAKSGLEIFDFDPNIKFYINRILPRSRSRWTKFFVSRSLSFHWLVNILPLSTRLSIEWSSFGFRHIGIGHNAHTDSTRFLEKGKYLRMPYVPTQHTNTPGSSVPRFARLSNSQSVQLCLTHFRLRISESSSSSAYGCSAVAMRIDEHKFSAPNRTEDMWKLRITVLLTQSVHVFCMCISSASKAQNFLGFVDFIRRIFAKTIPCILLGS